MFDAAENNFVARVVLRQLKSCLYDWRRGNLRGSFAVFYSFRSFFIILDN